MVRAIKNLSLVEALQETDEKLAIKLVSSEDLCQEELSELICSSMMGSIINKNTKEPLKLNKKVLQAALLNKVNYHTKNIEEDV